MGVLSIAMLKVIGSLSSGLFFVFIRNSILDGQLNDLDWWIRLSRSGSSKLDEIKWSLIFGICMIDWSVELNVIGWSEYVRWLNKLCFEMCVVILLSCIFFLIKDLLIGHC